MTSVELGDMLGDVLGWQEGWLLKVHEAGPSFCASRSRHNLPLVIPTGLTICLLQHVLTTVIVPVVDVRSRSCTRPNPAIVTAHWKFIFWTPRDPTPSNSPPSKKVQQNLTLAQTHEAPRQPRQQPFRTSPHLQCCIKSTLDSVELPHTAAVTQVTQFSSTSRPRAAPVLIFISSTSCA